MNFPNLPDLADLNVLALTALVKQQEYFLAQNAFKRRFDEVCSDETAEILIDAMIEARGSKWTGNQNRGLLEHYEDELSSAQKEREAILEGREPPKREHKPWGLAVKPSSDEVRKANEMFARLDM